MPHNHTNFLFLLAILTLLLCTPPQTGALPLLASPGFRTLGFSDQDRGLRFDVNVWYPAKKAPRPLKYPPWEFRGSLQAPPMSGRFPLIIVSHPSSGNRFSFYDTASELASSGFVVACLTHDHDNMDSMPQLYTWEEFAQRTRDISALIDYLLQDENIGPSIDPERIGILGIGAGAAAALYLGGALPDCSGWPAFCASEKNSVYCNSWAEKRISEKFCSALPLTKSLADTRVKAVAAASPDFSMLLSRESLRYFYPPLLLVTAPRESDGSRKVPEDLARLFPSAPKTVVIEKADNGTLMAPCPDSMIEELPEICRSVSGEERAAIHEEFVREVGSFFRHTLSGGEPAVIPQPPDLTPKKPQTVQAPPKGTEQKQRRPRRQKRQRQPSVPSQIPLP